MEMQQIRYFLAVAEVKNFTKAAVQCGVSPPSLLRAIGILEQEFGGALFTRERGNIRLTELGRITHPHLQQIVSEAELAKRHAKQHIDVERTSLKIGIMCTIAPSHFVSLVSSFQKRHPRIRLEILDRTATELQNALLAGDLELAIYGLPDQKSADKFHNLALFRERMVIALSESHPMCSNEPIRVSELNGVPYLERANCEFAHYGEQVFQAMGVDGETVYVSERDDWVLAMVAAGLGYSFLPESTSRFAGVKSRTVVEPEFWRQINLVTVRGRPHSPAVGAFVREVMRTNWAGSAALSKREHAETRARSKAR